MTKICKNEHALLDIYGITIPVINDDQKIGQIDTAATPILKKYHPIVLQNSSARHVCGDGNSLLRAVSSALFGSESHHLLLRLLTTIEIAFHRHIYDITDHQCILKDNRVVSSTYHDLLMSAVKPGQYAEMLHVYALSAALIQSYYPPLSLTDMTSAFRRKNCWKRCPGKEGSPLLYNVVQLLIQSDQCYLQRRSLCCLGKKENSTGQHCNIST